MIYIRFVCRRHCLDMKPPLLMTITHPPNLMCRLAIDMERITDFSLLYAKLTKFFYRQPIEASFL